MKVEVPEKVLDLIDELYELVASPDRETLRTENAKLEADADRLAVTMAALLQSLDDDKAGRSMSMRIGTTDSATRIARAALKAHEETK